MNKIIGYWWLPLLGLAVGTWLATQFRLPLTEEWAVFLAVAMVITLDLMVESTSQYINGRFSLSAATLTYLCNVLFSYFLLTIGHLMHVDLYIALFIVFGIKLFSNLSYISQKFFSKRQF